MSLDFQNLIAKCNPEEIYQIFEHYWPRLTNLVDQSLAFQLLQNLISGKNLNLLSELSDQEIIAIFTKQIKKQQQRGQKSLESKETKIGLKKIQVQIQKDQKSQSKQNSKRQQKLNIIKTQQKHKNQTQKLNIIKTQKLNIIQTQKSNIIKTQVTNQEEVSVKRLQRQLQLGLEQNKNFNKFTPEFVKKILQVATHYKKTIKILDRNQITREATSLRNQKPNIQNIYIFLQLVDSALYHTTKQHRLRQTQIISILLFLIGDCPKLLLEILTGEGKSTTVSSVAAILTISGKYVDIVTTNELLAKRDVQEKKSFYNLLGLDVDHNFVQNQRGEKDCYRDKKIVYGTPHSFQVDILFDEYKKRGTRCKRPFSVLIIDQVDSMFIDQKDHQTLLSTVFPGFSQLIHPMKIIWSKINFNPIFKENKELKMALAVGKNETVTGKITDVMDEVIKSIKKQYKNEMIPDWRMQFIDLSLQKWINSAITAAFIYKEKTQYIIKNGKIVPVDYKNNGALQENVHWENGLHQFLQIKHGLTVTTEGMTSNFISNLGHFDKYNELYGLTGTLGSDKAKYFLKQTYNADLMKVPPFKERRLEIELGSVLYNEGQWAKYICQRVKLMLVCERSVLILCQSIGYANLLHSALKIKNISADRIQNLQTGTEKINDNIDCRQIFIATNLAGRGSDLKISQKLNQRGGLHVIITFMPANSRVQMQGRGRAGRNGCNGSSQLAINYQKYCEQVGLTPQKRPIFETLGLDNPQHLLFFRDQIQTERMKQDQQKVHNLRCKDRIFNIYCEAVNKIPDFQKNNAKQMALEEKFAMFLKRADNFKLSYEDLEYEAIILTEEFKAKSDSFYNPNHYVERGFNELCERNNAAAIQMFERAEKDNLGSIPQIIGGTYANCCKLNRDRGDNQKIKNDLQNLQKIRQVIEHRKEMIRGSQIMNNELQNITDLHDRLNQRDELMFQMRLRGNENEPMQQMHHDFESYTDSRNERPARNTQMRDNINNMSSSEERILNGLSQHLQEIITKYQNLNKNQYIQINFQPIDDLLPKIQGDFKQNQEGLGIWKQNGLKKIPTAIIKKKKVSFWKRCLVFIMGVAQIVLGAIIVASTAGALTGVGIAAMMEGAKNCFDSIFRPEQLEKLGKYFSKTAINYAFALAASGLEGIRQLGTLSKNGFKMMKQMPLGTFVKKMMSNVGTGFQKVGLNYMMSLREAGNYFISSGLSNMIVNKQKDLRSMIFNPVQRVQECSDSIKQKIKIAEKQNSCIDKQYQRIRQAFSNQMSQQIKKLTSRVKNSHLEPIKNLPLNTSILSKLISSAVNQSFKLPTRGIQFQQILCGVKKEWGSSAAYRRIINFQQKMQECLKNLPKHRNFDLWIQQGLYTLVFQSAKKIRKNKKSIIERKKGQLTRMVQDINKNRNTMSQTEFNTRVQAYRQQQKQFNADVIKLNQYIENVDEKAIMDMIKQKKAMQKNGRLNSNVIRSLEIHEYTKEALLSLQYMNSQSSFEQVIQAGIFNVVGNYGLRIMDKIFYETGGSRQSLSDIEKLIKK